MQTNFVKKRRSQALATAIANKKKKNAEYEDADGFDIDEIADVDDADLVLPPINSRRLAARRAIEMKLDELELRAALEDFADYRILN